MSKVNMMLMKLSMIPRAMFVFGEDIEEVVVEPVVPPVVPPVKKPEVKPTGKVYTSTEFDAATLKIRKTLETKLEREANDNRATKAERDAAQTELDALRTEFTSKEKLAEQALTAAQKKHATEVKAERDARETAEKNYEILLIDVELQREEAFVKPSIPGALADAMRVKTKLVDELGDDGKKTGKKVVRLTFDDFDKDGKPIISSFPVKDAFKRMKEIPVKYGIYFEGVGTGGVGGNNGRGQNGTQLPAGELPKDIDSYAARRLEAKKANK